ncbi:MAG: hypothetical protein D8M58_21780 [Calditrichaeota bacterium]|nr:MAG: hypothetical protein DWQ03_00695 [Calditrichota bacterium]MBL1208046.1 hypothetical protein [Calditrichota bacterium]NOG47881.1 HAD-IB family phosphatase [Calditrichota bacterium]
MDPTITAAIITGVATLLTALITYITIIKTNRKKKTQEKANSIIIQPKDGYKIIGFDLDGTLLRGLEFSWTMVWDFLGFPEAVRKAGMRRYITQQTSYQEWCEWACDQFKEKGLKRSDFKKITENIQVTKNLNEAINILKNDGFIVGLISGGIDVFLYEKIPNADELFDHIYINKFLFDSNGLLTGVNATKYDFEGKAIALEKMCTENGFTLQNSIFVGEGFNDDEVAKKAGLAIAYPPKGQGMKAAANIEVAENDLLKILPHILSK